MSAGTEEVQAHAPLTGPALRDWRERHGLTIEQVAELLPCGTRTWAHWEAESRTPPRLLLRALRDAERELAVRTTTGRG